jgi:hypothetical protein
MRNLFKLFVFVLTMSLFCTNIIKAEPCHLFGKDSASGVKKQLPFHAFYSVDYGISWTNSSSQLNNWLLHEGYIAAGGNQSVFGVTETFFSRKWMFECEVHGLNNYGFGNATSMENAMFGAGYNLFYTKLFSVYGGVNLGVNSLYLQPNQTTAGDFGKYNAVSGSRFEQDAWLINPHILLYRNITKNLNARPGRIDAIGAGIDAGFNLAFSQSEWTYGYSNTNKLSATPVSGIPNSSFNGFYVMGRIGWYFGRQ